MLAKVTRPAPPAVAATAGCRQAGGQREGGQDEAGCCGEGQAERVRWAAAGQRAWPNAAAVPPGTAAQVPARAVAATAELVLRLFSISPRVYLAMRGDPVARSPSPHPASQAESAHRR